MFGFSKGSNETDELSIYFHEDHSSKQVNESTVGRKGLSLFKLRDMDVPIPDFFVLSPHIYRDFLFSAFDRKLGKLLEKVKDPDVKELEKIILSTDFDNKVRDEILKAYSRLSGFSNAWVAVRSSVVYPNDPSVSFSGIFSTELSVRGMDQLLNAIKQVFLSVFKERVVLYSRDKNIDVSALQMAVVVQRMVQPEVSGIAYTVDPVTGSKTSMSIEAVFGLGDVISEGAITPDRYALEKKQLDIVEKHISPQEWMRIRRPAEKKIGSGDDFQKIQISRSWSHQQKLEDQHLRDVAKVCLIIEHHERTPQMIEWSWESGNVWILQSKPIIDQSAQRAFVQSTKEVTTDSVFDIAVDMMKDEVDQRNIAVQEAEHITPTDRNEADEISDAIEVEKGQISEDRKEIEQLEAKIEEIDRRSENRRLQALEKKEEDILKGKEKIGLPTTPSPTSAQFVLSGIGSSVGITTGRLTVIDGSLPQKDTLVITKEDILLIKNFNSTLEPLLMRSGGIIMDEGGLTSDASILCRELELPAVVGTGLASTLLKDGEFVRIDGNVGSIYKLVKNVDEPKQKLLEKKQDVTSKAEESKRTEVKVKSDLDAVTRADELINNTGSKKVVAEAHGRHIPTATKVLLLPEPGKLYKDHMGYDDHIDGISYVDLETYMLQVGRHPMAFEADKKFKEYSKQFELILDEFSDNAIGKEVTVSLGSASVGQMRELTKGTSHEDSALDQALFGAQRLLRSKELFRKELNMIKRVRNVYKCRNISLAIHSPSNAQVMREVKKELSAAGLKRTGTFSVYAIIDSTSEIILIDEIIGAGIDGVIINTPLIARQIQGLSRFDKDAKYDLSTNSLWSIVSEIIQKIKGSKNKIIVVTEDSTSLVKNCIRSGVYGISVPPENVQRTKQLVADEEAKMIMSME